MKHFLQFWWNQRIHRILAIALLVGLVAINSTTGNYVAWSIWYGAVFTTLVVVGWELIGLHRWHAQHKAARFELDFWMKECLRIYDEFKATPAWDWARRERLTAQFAEALQRYDREAIRAKAWHRLHP